MIYFTSDWHLGEDRIGINGKPNLFYRPFNSIDQQDNTIISNFISKFKDGDTLYHLGDVLINDIYCGEKYLKLLKFLYPNSEFNLILGNYDVDHVDILSKYFNVRNDATLDLSFGLCYLNHYPTKTLNDLQDAQLGITGHIHSLWKVQKELINVGVDAWNYMPVSIDEIEFCYNAMQNHYDNDVFVYTN